MASLLLEGDELVVCLSGAEQMAAMRGDVHVPLSDVQTVSVDPDPWCALRGVRAPGTGLPGMVAYGVRRLTGDRPDFAAVHGRGPAVRIELGPRATFRRLLVTVEDPEQTVAKLRER
ncbi:MAG: hypothetical protein WAK93_10795 [Solirubrobacteraceae bacterium]